MEALGRQAAATNRLLRRVLGFYRQQLGKESPFYVITCPCLENFQEEGANNDRGGGRLTTQINYHRVHEYYMSPQTSPAGAEEK